VRFTYRVLKRHASAIGMRS